MAACCCASRDCLAAGDDTLTPTALRRGGRLLGGALSWETPKHIAPFETDSPFFGLAAPDEVTVTRQVLAEPEAGVSEKTWARLADGTPLVTAARRGKGLIVLFHVTADTTWSNLPLSGLFVDMLRRIEAEADAPGQSAVGSVKAGEHGVARPPLRTLNGFGVLEPPPAQAEPIGEDFPGVGDVLHPPGFYGTRNSLRAVNTLAPGEKLAAANYAPLAVQEGALATAPPIDLRRWLLPAALVGLMIDALFSIWLMGGGAPLRRKAAIAALALVGMMGFAAVPHHVWAAESPPVSERDMDAALSTRLAYVATGDSSVDETSRLGLTALTRVLAARTSAELADPVALRSGARRTRFLSTHLLADRRRVAAAEVRGAHAHRRVHEERRHYDFRYARRADGAPGRAADARGALAPGISRGGRRSGARARSRTTMC